MSKMYLCVYGATDFDFIKSTYSKMCREEKPRPYAHVQHSCILALDQPLVIPNSEICVVLIEFVGLGGRNEGHLMTRNDSASRHCGFSVTSLHFAF